MSEENLSGAFTYEQEQWEFWLQSDPDYERWLDSLEALRADQCREIQETDDVRDRH